MTLIQVFVNHDFLPITLKGEHCACTPASVQLPGCMVSHMCQAWLHQSLSLQNVIALFQIPTWKVYMGKLLIRFTY